MRSRPDDSSAYVNCDSGSFFLVSNSRLLIPSSFVLFSIALQVIIAFSNFDHFWLIASLSRIQSLKLTTNCREFFSLLKAS
jgi:hypothetical protein